MGNIAYTDVQRSDFLEVASDIGISRAMRKLGYPAGWGTAKSWMDAAGISVPLDEIKAKAKEHHQWYETEDMLLIAQEGLQRVYLELQQTELNPDEHKKLSEAYQKYANTWLLLQGRANSINENRSKDSMDLGIIDMLNEEKARNALIENDSQVTVR